jgi:hypothetical protein
VARRSEGVTGPIARMDRRCIVSSPESMTEEKTIFHGSPSQVLNVDVYIGCALGAITVVV